jgi:hypothetical protein
MTSQADAAHDTVRSWLPWASLFANNTPDPAPSRYRLASATPPLAPADRPVSAEAPASGLALTSVLASPAADPKSAPYSLLAQADRPQVTLQQGYPRLGGRYENTTVPGGRGLITDEGITGMFLNPTSGTLNRGQLDVEFCTGVYGGDVGFAFQLMVAYGILDWLEVGVTGILFDTIGILENIDSTVEAIGPFVRVRLLKDESYWPEVAVGYFSREGNAVLQRRSVFIAASKGVQFGSDFIIPSIRAHVGMRHLWHQDIQFNFAKEGTIFYWGGEIELPRHIYIVGEVSSKEHVYIKRPYSIGVQVRHPAGVALTLAAVQTGIQRDTGLYIGIGINFR